MPSLVRENFLSTFFLLLSRCVIIDLMTSLMFPSDLLLFQFYQLQKEWNDHWSGSLIHVRTHDSGSCRIQPNSWVNLVRTDPWTLLLSLVSSYNSTKVSDALKKCKIIWFLCSCYLTFRFSQEKHSSSRSIMFLQRLETNCFQTCQFLLLAWYRYSSSPCSTMGPIRLGSYSHRFPPFGSSLSVEWAYTTSCTGTQGSSMQFLQFSCSDLWETSIRTTGDLSAASFSALEVGNIKGSCHIFLFFTWS